MELNEWYNVWSSMSGIMYAFSLCVGVCSLQPCMHCYCGGCYSEWMKDSNKCPTVSAHLTLQQSSFCCLFVSVDVRWRESIRTILSTILWKLSSGLTQVRDRGEEREGGRAEREREREREGGREREQREREEEIGEKRERESRERGRDRGEERESREQREGKR